MGARNLSCFELGTPTEPENGMPYFQLDRSRKEPEEGEGEAGSGTVTGSIIDLLGEKTPCNGPLYCPKLECLILSSVGVTFAGLQNGLEDRWKARCLLTTRDCHWDVETGSPQNSRSRIPDVTSTLWPEFVALVTALRAKENPVEPEVSTKPKTGSIPTDHRNLV